MLFRILTIREHKTVTFCDAYSYDLYRQQLMFSNSVLGGVKLAVGSVVDIEWHFDVNRQGNKVVLVEKIIDQYMPKKNNPYKSYHSLDSDGRLDNELANELNGGIHLARWKHYISLIHYIQEYMSELGIIQIFTPILTPYRGTSKAKPARVLGEYIGNQYIKITHELELKKKVYTSLTPVFELGYVVRDRYTTKTGLNEFLTLEAVLPNDFSFDLADFYLHVLSKAISLAKDLTLEYNKAFDNVDVVDVFHEYKKVESEFDVKKYMDFFEQISARYQHVIFLNAPLDSPLGWQSDYGIPLETQWNLNNHGIGHGYYDEYRVEILLQEFTRQKVLLEKQGLEAELPEDYLKYCEYGSIPTYSFNLGIERFHEFFFCHQMDSVSK